MSVLIASIATSLWMGRDANKAAIIWEGEPGDHRTLTYQQLHYEVCRFANGLKKLGLVKGDRVGIYMPMVPEAAVAMLACARPWPAAQCRLRRIFCTGAT